MTPQQVASTTVEAPETARLYLAEMGPSGDTIAYLNGEAVNVFGGIAGETVVAEIHRYRRRKRSFVSAVVTEVLETSPYRVDAPCGYFGACTGCQWQHISYAHQLRLKHESVLAAFAGHPELADLAVAGTLPASSTFGYRNHARFHVRRQGHLGFSNRITHRFVQINHCMLMAPWINDAVSQLQGRVGESTAMSLRCGVNTGDWLVQPRLVEADVPLATGQTHYRETVLGKTFRVSSPSFFQVNSEQAERLAAMVIDSLHLTGDETVVDAYAGVGMFAALAASKAAKVIAIEESKAAVKDMAINTLGLENVELVEAKTETALAELRDRPDAVILDPPRNGCHPDALDAVARLRPSRVVYVSCDPESLARDLAHLTRAGLAVEEVVPVDMFPQTHHIECVAKIQPQVRSDG